MNKKYSSSSTCRVNMLQNNADLYNGKLTLKKTIAITFIRGGEIIEILWYFLNCGDWKWMIFIIYRKKSKMKKQKQIEQSMLEWNRKNAEVRKIEEEHWNDFVERWKMTYMGDNKKCGRSWEKYTAQTTHITT